MRDLLPDLETWLAASKRVALATVISTWGSAPRPVGSFMAINEDGGMVGSVSGGCVEGAVIQAAKETIHTQKPQLLHFGVADETAWEVGLACGGKIDVFIQPVHPHLIETALNHIKAEQPIILHTVVSGQEEILGAQMLTDDHGTVFESANWDMTISEKSPAANHPEIITNNGIGVFANPFPAPPTLVMVGGVHISVALVKLARTLNFRTVIIDPRRAFGSAERFEQADQVIQAWPQQAFEQIPLTRSTAVASLSHDPKIDDPALIAALASNAFYVGALGSKKTTEKRRERLLASGVTEESIHRLHAPIGVDINAQTPEEIALSIMAQIIADYRT